MTGLMRGLAIVSALPAVLSGGKPVFAAFLLMTRHVFLDCPVDRQTTVLQTLSHQ